MKKLILPLLIICSSSAYSEDENLTPFNAAKTLTNEIGKHITGYNSDNYMYMNNRIVYWNLKEWNDVLFNTFNECDEMAVEFQDAKLKKTCYAGIVESFLKWLEVSIDPSISNYVWKASGSSAFSSNNPRNAKVDFKIWVTNIPKFRKQEADNNLSWQQKDLERSLRQNIFDIATELVKEEKKIIKNKSIINKLKLELTEAKLQLENFKNGYDGVEDNAM